MPRQAPRQPPRLLLVWRPRFAAQGTRGHYRWIALLARVTALHPTPAPGGAKKKALVTSGEGLGGRRGVVSGRLARAIVADGSHTLGGIDARVKIRVVGRSRRSSRSWFKTHAVAELLDLIAYPLEELILAPLISIRLVLFAIRFMPAQQDIADV
jgi:hypothetical protein